MEDAKNNEQEKVKLCNSFLFPHHNFFVRFFSFAVLSKLSFNIERYKRFYVLIKRIQPKRALKATLANIISNGIPTNIFCCGKTMQLACSIYVSCFSQQTPTDHRYF